MGKVAELKGLDADKNMFTGGGGGIKKNNTQGFLNKTIKGTSHSSIDNAMTPYLKPLIKRTSQGVDPIKWFNNANWSNFNQSIPKIKKMRKVLQALKYNKI